MNTAPVLPGQTVIAPAIDEFVLLGKKRPCPDYNKMKRPYSDYTHDKRLLFERGMMACKGTRALVGYNGKEMNLQVEEEPMTYDDSLRELHGLYSAAVCNDVCPVNVLQCSSRREMQQNQAMCFSADDTQVIAYLCVYTCVHTSFPRKMVERGKCSHEVRFARRSDARLPYPIPTGGNRVCITRKGDLPLRLPTNRGR